MTIKVGIIGLGAMGEGIARNLAKEGFLHTLYNRTNTKAKNIANELALPYCNSPQNLAKQVDVILMCVSADQDVLEIVNKISETITPNSIVIDLSTISIETAKESARILATKQAHFLDSPVSGGVEGAKKGSLAMMVGGNKAILDQITAAPASHKTLNLM